MASLSFQLVPQKVPPVDTPFRTIKTAIPVPQSIPLLKKMCRYESRSMHGQLPIIWDSAEDAFVKDPWGNQWIDFTSTIFVANAGHANPEIISALQDCLNKPLLHTYSYANMERINYLEYFVENTPVQFEKAYLLSAGTEATEAAMKLMRIDGQQHGKRRGGIICLDGAYHGRTMGAQMMTGNKKAKAWMEFHDPNIHHLPFPSPNDPEVQKDPAAFFEKTFAALLDENDLDPGLDLCGFMLETFQGWGAIFFPKEYIEALKNSANKYGILVCFDEMQAGFGRTGKLFGYMHYDIEPDILCLGKGASSGLPLALVTASAKIMDLPDIGSMSSTHSANPLCCAAGLANLKVLTEGGLVSNAEELGRYFHEILNQIAHNHSNVDIQIKGVGLLAAILIYDKQGKPQSKLCDRVCELALQRGLILVNTGRESIKLAPPLSIKREILEDGLTVLSEALSDALGEQP